MADEETNIRRPYAELGLVWLQIWQTVQTPDTADQSSPIRYPAIRPDLAGGESDAIQSTPRSAFCGVTLVLFAMSLRSQR
jgi:hypothetical protein